MKRAVLSAFALLTLGGCGYFNTMYNANKSFADAEKAAARGDATTAASSYRASIEKANKSLNKSPAGRWSGPARLIVARANYALGNLSEANHHFDELSRDADATRSAIGIAYLGIIAAHEGVDSSAITHLNRAIDSQRLPEDVAALAHLSRAKLHLRFDRADAALSDLRAVRDNAGTEARIEAHLLRVRIASAQKDTAAARVAIAELLNDRDAQHASAAVQQALHAATSDLGPAALRQMLAGAGSSAWRASARDSLLLLRANLAVALGDTAAAVQELEALAQASTGPHADLIRVRAAELKLLRATTLDELGSTRAALLPALASDRARSTIQAIKTLEILIEKANRTGQPLLIFAAAELARDDLGAPRLASRLFTTYVDVAPQTVWAGKALLAALPLEDGARADELRRRLDQYRDNTYVAAVHGTTDDAAYEAAEDRLNKTIEVARSEAIAEAARRDNTVTRAVATMDSLRLVARTDSTRVACGIMIDSLSIGGIRADSVRAACLRGDRPRITMLLKVDTLMLRDSTRARADSTNARRPRRDTTFYR